MPKCKGQHGGKKGQKIRAWVDPPPPHPYIRAMPKRKRFFSIDVFPKKSYSCTQCNYSCARSYNLKTHMKIHIGEKPYS